MNNHLYNSRKTAEIQFLYKVAHFFGLPKEQEYSFSSKFELLQKKDELRALIKCANIYKNKDILNTNIHCINMINNWLYTKYSYRRYSAYLSDKDYTESNDEFKFFVNCGMSALASLFLATENLGYAIFTHQAYFETIKMLQEKKRKGLHRKISFYDSLEEKICVENIDTKHSFIDTTCLSLSEEQLLIKQLHEKQVNAVLVRSNVKLDMLGIDYSNLGTVTYITAKSHPSSLFNRLLDQQIKWLGRFGAFPDPCDIPVFWMKQFYSEFIILNDIRLQICKANNAYAYAYLKKFGFTNLELKWHSYFVLVHCSEREKRNYSNNFEKFKQECSGKDIPVYNNGSFGTDATLVDSYQDWSSKKEYIRIAFSDLDLIDVEVILNLFIKYFLET